jgi:toxin ParE1/3/4
VSALYAVKPRAVSDLDDYSGYLAEHAPIGVDYRFLRDARATFALLATRPNMGWAARLSHRDLESLRLFRVSGFEHMLILYRPVPAGVEILRVVHGSRNVRALFRRREEIE